MKALAEHGRWHSMCGWTWTNDSETLKVLESLVRRGVVVKTLERMPWGHTVVVREVYRAVPPVRF